jgi:hypothetical protein
MFSLDTGAPPPGGGGAASSSSTSPASSASPTTAAAATTLAAAAAAALSPRATITPNSGGGGAASVVSMIGAAVRDSLRRSSTASDPGGGAYLSDVNDPYQRRPSYTIGGTRSRENSVSSIGSDELPNFSGAAAQGGMLAGTAAGVGAKNNNLMLVELHASLQNVRSNCMDLATKLVQLSSELQAAVAESVGSTAVLLQEHTSSLADFASVVAAAIKAARNQGANHQVVKDKLAELQELAGKVSRLKNVALRIETEVEALQNMGDPKKDEEEKSNAVTLS